MVFQVETDSSNKLCSATQHNCTAPGSWIEIDWKSDKDHPRSWIDIEWITENAIDGRRKSGISSISQNHHKKPHTSLFKDISGFLLGRRTGLLINPIGILKDKYGLEDLDTFWAREEKFETGKQDTQARNKLHTGKFSKERKICDQSISKVSKLTELSYTMRNRSAESFAADLVYPLESFESNQSDVPKFEESTGKSAQLVHAINPDSKKDLKGDEPMLQCANVSLSGSKSLVHQQRLHPLNETDCNEENIDWNVRRVFERIQDSESSISGESSNKSRDSLNSLDTLDLRFLDVKPGTASAYQESPTLSAIPQQSNSTSSSSRSLLIGAGELESPGTNASSINSCEYHPELPLPFEKAKDGDLVNSAVASDASMQNSIQARNMKLIPTRSEGQVVNPHSPKRSANTFTDAACSSTPLSATSDMELVSPSPVRCAAAIGNADCSLSSFHLTTDGTATRTSDNGNRPSPNVQYPNPFLERMSGIFDELLRADESAWTPESGPDKCEGSSVQLQVNQLEKQGSDDFVKSSIKYATSLEGELAEGDMDGSLGSALTAAASSDAPPACDVQTLPRESPSTSATTAPIPGDVGVKNCTSLPELQTTSAGASQKHHKGSCPNLVVTLTSSSSPGADRNSVGKESCSYSPGPGCGSEPPISTADVSFLPAGADECADLNCTGGTSEGAEEASCSPRLVALEEVGRQCIASVPPPSKDETANVSLPQRDVKPRRAPKAANNTGAVAVWAEGPQGSGRSRRKVIRPLQFWRNERVEYLRAPGAPIPEICAVVLRSPEQPAGGHGPRRRASVRMPSKATKLALPPRHSSRTAQDSDSDSEPETSTGGGPVMPADDEGGSGVAGPRGRTPKSQAKKRGGPKKKPSAHADSGQIRSAAARSSGTGGRGSAASRTRISAPQPEARERSRKRSVPEDAPPAPAQRTSGGGCGSVKVAKRRLYALAMAAFRDDRFDSCDDGGSA